MTETLVCWKCGASVEDLPLPLGRYAECLECGAELYVCRMCEFYDTKAADSCREPMAEVVKDKERANFCDYYQARPGAYDPEQPSNADAARARLESLFGGSAGADTVEEGNGSSGRDPAREELERLFKPGPEDEDR